MKIILKISKENNIKISLFEGKKEKDSLEWEENNSLSRFLLVKLDKLLRQNGTGLDKISGFDIINDIPSNWTSVRIAKITFESLMISRKAARL